MKFFNKLLKLVSTKTFCRKRIKTKTENYSDEMIKNASYWTSYFLQEAPQLDSGTYQKDEIYMFCCWILLDYGIHYGYLDKNSNIDCFYSTIYQAVRNTGKYNQSDSVWPQIYFHPE